MIIMLSSWINHEQQQANDYLRTENDVLKEFIGKKRILLNEKEGQEVRSDGSRREFQLCVSRNPRRRWRGIGATSAKEPQHERSS